MLSKLEYILYNAGGCYDIMTVGGFTAYAQKYKRGGLKRMLRTLHEAVASNNNNISSQSQLRAAANNNSDDSGDILETIGGVQNDICRLRAKVDDCCETVCRYAVQGQAQELSTAMTELSDKVGAFIHVGGEGVDRGRRYAWKRELHVYYF